jgi:hypothetical protein
MLFAIEEPWMDSVRFYAIVMIPKKVELYQKNMKRKEKKNPCSSEHGIDASVFIYLSLF